MEKAGSRNRKEDDKDRRKRGLSKINEDVRTPIEELKHYRNPAELPNIDRFRGCKRRRRAPEAQLSSDELISQGIRILQLGPRKLHIQNVKLTKIQCITSKLGLLRWGKLVAVRIPI